MKNHIKTRMTDQDSRDHKIYDVTHGPTHRLPMVPALCRPCTSCTCSSVGDVWQHEQMTRKMFVLYVDKNKMKVKCLLDLETILGPYSPTILKNILSLVLQIFLCTEAFERNTTSDWLNHTV